MWQERPASSSKPLAILLWLRYAQSSRTFPGFSRGAQALKPGVRAFHHAQASPWKEASMSTDLGAVAFGLVASCSWGAAEFSGGVATRRAPGGRVVGGTLALGLV